MKVFLDDLRFPPDDSWIVLRNSKEACDFFDKHGLTGHWSFDHDLGGDDTTMIFLWYAIEKDMDNSNMIRNFTYDVHSANPVGVENIRGLLKSYLNHKEQNVK